MLRLLAKLVLAGAVLAALWLWVPVGGRTLAARWERAGGSFPAFVERGWAELSGRGGAKPPAERRPTARSQARAQGASRPRPTEGHTDSDRRALDRVLADELRTHH